MTFSLKTTTAAALILMIAAPTLAHAETKSAPKSAFSEALSGVYIAGQAGYNNTTEKTLDDGAVFSGSVGYHLNPFVRIEGEVAYRQNDYSQSILGIALSGDSKITNYMLNGWYDFANTTGFTPYVGGGIGLAAIELTAKAPAFPAFGSYTENDSAFAYQLGGGVAYAMTADLALTADYRFIDTAEFKDLETDYKAHEIRAGVRYSF